MNANYMVIECQQGHRFRYGLLDKGYSECPHCDSLVGKPYYASREKVEQLARISQVWQDKQKDDKGKSLSIQVDMNTDKLQLKLRSIASHLESLADELDAIDKKQPCDCGSYNTTIVKGGSIFICFDCEKEEELPTHLEGSK